MLSLAAPPQDSVLLWHPSSVCDTPSGQFISLFCRCLVTIPARTHSAQDEASSSSQQIAGPRCQHSQVTDVPIQVAVGKLPVMARAKRVGLKPGCRQEASGPEGSQLLWAGSHRWAASYLPRWHRGRVRLGLRLQCCCWSQLKQKISFVPGLVCKLCAQPWPVTPEAAVISGLIALNTQPGALHMSLASHSSCLLSPQTLDSGLGEI